MDTADAHQHRIARDTVRNPLKGKFLGGPSAEEAEKTLRSKFGYSDKQINKLREDEFLDENKSIGKRVRIDQKGVGFKEFHGKKGRIVGKEGDRYRVKLDSPVHIPGIGHVHDDLWDSGYLKRLREDDSLDESIHEAMRGPKSWYKFGHELHPDDQKHALNAYVHRYTGEHKPQWANQPRQGGGEYKPHFRDDKEWLHNTEFSVRTNGRLHKGVKQARSHPTWPEGTGNPTHESEVNELSRGTLGSYLRKNHKSMLEARRKGDDRKDANRMRGRFRATDKISAKNEESLDEVKKKDRAAYAKFWAHDPEAGKRIEQFGAKERAERKSFASGKREIDRLKKKGK